MKAMKRVTACLCGAAAVLAAGTPARASTKTWVGPNNGDFEITDNWTGGTPADDLTSDVALLNTANLAQLTKSRGISGLSFSYLNSNNPGIGSASAGYVLSLGSGGITVGGDYVSPLISANLLVASNQTWNLNQTYGGYRLTASGNLSGSSTLTLTGRGTTVLAGADNSGFTGTVILNNHRLIFGSGNTFQGNLGPGATIIVSDGGLGASGYSSGTITSALRLSGSITLGGADGNNSDLVFSGATELTGAIRLSIFTRTDTGSGSVTLSGNLTGPYGIDYLGANAGAVKSLTLSGAANHFSGPLNVVAGTVNMNAPNGGIMPVTIYPGARLSAAVPGVFAGGSTATVQGAGGALGVLALGYDAAPPALDATSCGVLALNVNSNYTPALDLSALGDGTMFLGATAATAIYTAASLTAGSGHAYRLGAGGGTLTFDRTASADGALAGANDLIVGKAGGWVNVAGTAATRDNQAFTGAITIHNDSTLRALLNDLPAGAVTPFGGDPGGTVTLNGGTLALDKNAAAGGGGRTVTKGALTYAGSSTVSLTGDAARTVQLTVDSLTREATYGAGLIVAGASALGSNERFIVAAGGPARSASTGQFMVAPYLVAGDGRFLDYPDANGFKAAGFDYTWSSLSDTGSSIGTNDIVKYTANGATAANATILCKAFSGVGGIVLNADAGGSSKLTLVSGGLTASGGNVWIRTPVQFGPDDALVEGCVYVAGGSSLANIPDMMGAGLTKFGPGTLLLTGGAHSLTGTVTVAGGTLIRTRGSAEQFPNIDGYVLNGGTIGNINHILISKPITVGPLGGTIQHSVNNANVDISGNILAGSPQSGVLILSYANAGNAGTLSGAGNTYDGGTIIQGNVGGYGRVIVAAGSSLGTGPVAVLSGALTLNGDRNIAAGATLTVNGTASFLSAAPAIGALAGGGNVVLGVAGGQVTTLGIGGANTDSTFAGAIGEAGPGKGRLSKTGAGTLTLSGANAYTGPTTVSNGTLRVNGRLAAGSSVTVRSGATLGGSGTIGGVVTNEAGSVLAPGGSATLTAGAGVGTLTLGANLVLLDGAILAWEANAATQDLVAVNGSLALGAGTTLKLHNAGVARHPDGDYTLITYTGADPALGAWTIDYGTTGWSDAKVLLDTASSPKQVLLRVSGRKGSVLLVF